MIRQRTNEWYEARKGIFTASRFGDIMSNPADKSADISKTAMKYINKKAWEWHSKHKKTEPTTSGKSSMEQLSELLQSYKKFHVSDIQEEARAWGRDHEDAALELFTQRTKIPIQEGGLIFYQHNENIAATPDAFIYENNQLKATIQVKCPFNSKYHLKYMQKVKDALSLKKTKKDYYWQMVSEMWISSVKESWFVSYDPRMPDSEQLHRAKIKLIEEDMQLLLQRLQRAISIRNQKIGL